ncbi:MAG: (Fe-S)-binding protein [Magnetospirillum sp.]|nr:(Fe-S)-binding protein [Magnetospirillum sp.]
MTLSLGNGLAALREQIDAPVAAFFSSCVHCGLCAEACLFYTETGDPHYAPIRKLEPLRRLWSREFTLFGRIGAALGLSRPLTEADLAEWEVLVYDSCTLCGRCSLACPVGNDLTAMIRKLREGMTAAGYAPEGLKKAAVRALTGISPVGVGEHSVRKLVEAQAAACGIPIEMDKEGADWLVTISSIEFIAFPEVLGALAKLFKAAGATWTIASDAYEATNIGVQIGSRDVAGTLVQRIVDAAHRLKVKGVVTPECGHAYQALRWEGPNLIGAAYDVEVIHIIDLLDRWRAAGKLKTSGKDTSRLTYHDPCQISRRGGLEPQARRLMAMVAADFVETADAGPWNWCCGGGGGLSANHRAKDLRLTVFGPKKRQLEAVKPEGLVTACSNCRNILEEALQHYDMDLPVLGLVEMLAEYLDEEPS